MEWVEGASRPTGCLFLLTMVKKLQPPAGYRMVLASYPLENQGFTLQLDNRGYGVGLPGGREDTQGGAAGSRSEPPLSISPLSQLQASPPSPS